MINSLEKFALGTVEQWVLIRGDDESNPFLIFLHGGPGMPLFTIVKDLEQLVGLGRAFNTVYWEQRGTGKSYSSGIPPSSMKIIQFVYDIIELTNCIREKYKVPKVYLLGHSWGSIIGLLAVKHSPELFYSYVGTGQIVDMLTAEKICYNTIYKYAQENNDTRALRDLKNIGQPPYSTTKVMKIRKWAQYYGGFRRDNQSGVFRLFVKTIFTREYNWSNIIQMVLNPFFSLNHLLTEMYTVNFFNLVPRVEVPVYFLAGKYDIISPIELLESYFQMLEAPQGKQLIHFNSSAHFPFFEEPNHFWNIMVHNVIKK